MSVAEPPGTSLAQALGIDLGQFVRRVDHLVAYAELTRRETTEPESAGLLPPAPASDERRFELLLDAASALREAAQLALVSAPERASDLLRRSGQLYLQASVPYGVYLSALSGRLDAEAYERHLSNALRSIEHPRGRTADTPDETGSQAASDASAAPQQQIYLLLAGLASAEDRPPDRQLNSLMERSPHRNSNLPVGALGIPTMRYWSAAEALTHQQPTHGEPPDETLSVIEWLAGRHADVIASARTNEYLWRNLASPVDVIDLDVVGLSALIMRRFGVEQVMKVLAHRMDQRSSLELLHLQLAGSLV